MRLTGVRRFWVSPWRSVGASTNSLSVPLIRIKDATFYRRQPAANSSEENDNPPLFPNLNFELPSHHTSQKHCAIVGPSNAGKTTFLDILRGQHLCFPPAARSYPYLSSAELLKKDPRLSWPNKAVQYVGFGAQPSNANSSATYLSARYESRRESADFSLLDFLRGKTQLNALEENQENYDHSLLDSVINDLRLANLVGMPLNNLSNGQTRRARIAKALLGKPELLLLDEPFMGLDPPTTIQLNPLLRSLAHSSSPRLLLALRSQDPIPDWITHVLYLGNTTQVTHQGSLVQVIEALKAGMDHAPGSERQHLEHIPRFNTEFGRVLTDDGIMMSPAKLAFSNRKKYEKNKAKWDKGERTEEVRHGIGLGEVMSLRRRADFRKHEVVEESQGGEPLVEMSGVTVRYGENAVLGNWDKQYEFLDQRDPSTRSEKFSKPTLLSLPQPDEASQSGLHWTVRRGQRWCIIGPNGSGKTTLLSLITSDHPQAYALPIKLFGRARLPKPGQPGISIFDIQSRIGHASPEVHAFFPKHLSVRATLESAYADTPLSPPSLDAKADARISACLRWFQGDLNPAAGHNPLLVSEMLNTDALPKRDYSRPGNHIRFAKERAEHWYSLNATQEDAIDWADDMRFSEMTLSGQRVALFLRAIVAQPDIVILDEAFSGMDDVVRDKCLLFLDAGETKRLSPYRNHRRRDGVVSNLGFGEDDRTFKEMENTGITIDSSLMTEHQALICVSHVREEIPRCVTRWMYLPEGGGLGIGRSDDDGKPPNEPRPVFATSRVRTQLMDTDPRLWELIWNIPMLPRRDATAADVESIEKAEAQVAARKEVVRLKAEAQRLGRRKHDGTRQVRQPKLPKEGGRQSARSTPTMFTIDYGSKVGVQAGELEDVEKVDEVEDPDQTAHIKEERGE